MCDCIIQAAVVRQLWEFELSGPWVCKAVKASLVLQTRIRLKFGVHQGLDWVEQGFVGPSHRCPADPKGRIFSEGPARPSFHGTTG